MEIVRTLSATPAAAGQARESMLALDGLLPPSRMDDVRLVVSEMVTNVLEHSGLSDGEGFLLRIDTDPQRVRVAVIDDGGRFDDVSRRPAGEHGWGLAIVRSLADHWGAELGVETTVWAEFDL